MPRRYKHHARYRHGIIRRVDGRFLAEVNHGEKRNRCRCDTEDEARRWIDRQSIEVDRLSAQPTAAELAEWRAAKAILPPGTGLIEAARALRASTPSAGTDTLGDVYAAFLVDKEAAGRRVRTLENLRVLCGALVRDLGGQPIATISPSDLAEWLAAKDVTATTRGNYRRAWCGLWRWAKRSGKVVSIAPEALSPPTRDASTPGILTPAQGRNLLQAAIELAPDYVAAIALGMFAGLRSSEISALCWEAISDTHIRIVPAVAKARRQRLVPIPDNLRSILARCRANGRVCGYDRFQADHKLTRCRLAAGIAVWPHNALRHSFASYHLALHNDAGLTAALLGHSLGSGVLWEHYRELVTEDAAREWFGIAGTFSVHFRSEPVGPCRGGSMRHRPAVLGEMAEKPSKNAEKSMLARVAEG